MNNIEIKNDPVNHPSHYTQGKIECIDFIQDKKLNFCKGNAIKYIVRAGHKDPDKEIEDLEKAIFYLNAEIKELKANKEASHVEWVWRSKPNYCEVCRTKVVKY